MVTCYTLGGPKGYSFPLAHSLPNSLVPDPCTLSFLQHALVQQFAAFSWLDWLSKLKPGGDFFSDTRHQASPQLREWHEPWRHSPLRGDSVLSQEKRAASKILENTCLTLRSVQSRQVPKLYQLADRRSTGLPMTHCELVGTSLYTHRPHRQRNGQVWSVSCFCVDSESLVLQLCGCPVQARQALLKHINASPIHKKPSKSLRRSIQE